MSISPDDLAQLRSKLSDDQIVDGLSATSPEDASDIKTLQGKGLKSSQILEGFSKYSAPDPAPAQPSGFLQGAKNLAQAVPYGIAQEAHALGATSKALGGSGNWAQAVEDGANKIGGLAGDMANYRAATADMGLDKSLWSNISSIPRAMIEGLPMVGGMAAAAAAAPEVAGAGLAASAAYGLARNLGTTANERAANNGHEAPTAGDVAGALPGAALRGVVDAAGNRMLMTNGIMSPNAVTGAGAKAMAQTAVNLGKTTATNAATGAASDAIGQAGSEIGTNKGYSPDVGQSLNAGVVGGLTSAGLKGLEAVPQSLANNRLKAADPAVRNAVADDLNSTRFTGSPDDPADHGKLMTNALNGYTQDVSSEMKTAAAAAKEIDLQGGSTSHITDALDYAKNLMTNLKQGKLDADQVDEAKQKLSGQPALLNSILKVNEVHVISELADLKGVNTTTTPSIMDYYKGYKAYKGMTYMAGASLMGGHPVLAGALAATPFAITALAKAKAAMMGDNRIVGNYAQRFGSAPGAEGASPPMQAPEPQQAPPEGPVLHGELLPPPPIYGGRPAPQYGSHDGVPQGEAYDQPQAAPEAPLQLAAPMRQLPPPGYINGPMQATERGMALGNGEQAPGFLMLRNALQKAQASQPAPREQAPQEAPPAPQASPEAPANPKVAAKVAKVIEKAQAAPPPPTFNEQADSIEKTLADAQAVIKDPTSSPEAVAMAKSAARKAALGAAAQHDASHGGSKGVKKAPAAHAPAAHNGKTSSSESEHAGHTGAHVTPDMTHIHTSVGEKVQANVHIQKSAEAIGQGVVKSRGTRFEIADAAKKLPLSAAGKAHVGEAMDSLKSKAEASATNNRAYGKAALAESLKGFSSSDHAMLQHHFDTAASSHGIRFLDSWKHATPEAKTKADVMHAGFAKAKITRKANAAKKAK